MTMHPVLRKLKTQLDAAFRDESWSICVPTFATFAQEVEDNEPLRNELQKITGHMQTLNKSHVSYDAIAERSHVTLNRTTVVFEELIAAIEPLPSTTHIAHLIDTIRAVELLLTSVQSSTHVHDLFNRWYFLLCPAYYPDSCKAEQSFHSKMLKEFLMVLGLMLCAVVPPSEELHNNFSGKYAWCHEPGSDSFNVSKKALREGPSPSAAVSPVFGVSTSWFQEEEPATMHRMSGTDVQLDFFHHIMQYTQGFCTDSGSFVSNFEPRLFGVYEDFLSTVIGQLKKQLEESQSMKTKIFSQLQTKAFTGVQLLAQSLFHCLTFCHL